MDILNSLRVFSILRGIALVAGGILLISHTSVAATVLTLILGVAILPSLVGHVYRDLAPVMVRRRRVQYPNRFGHRR